MLDHPPLRLSGPPTSTLTKALHTLISSMLQGKHPEAVDKAESAWAAWLGFYNSMSKRLNWDKRELVEHSKLFANSIGLKDIPNLPIRTLNKMGLNNVEGLKGVQDTPKRKPSNGSMPRDKNQSTKSPKSR